MPATNPLLDPPGFPADGYAALADRLKALFATTADIVFLQAEAILALEAAATSLGRPGMVAVNVVTSPYGRYLGEWLRRAGAEVHDVVAEPGLPISVATVKASLEALPRIDLVALVHAETSSGILNPLPEIAALVRSRGALLMLDAVASAGGHAFDIDGLGIDVCAIGPQKALGGPTGLSILSVSQRAWQSINRPTTPSILSLADLKSNWLDQGRGALPGMPSALEFWALEAALDRIEAETLPALIARHQLAARATRAGLVALGVTPWVDDAAQASTLATAAPVPVGISSAAVIATAQSLGVKLTPGFGEIEDKLVRLDHTGPRAAFSSVLAAVTAYGSALDALGAPVDIGKAADAVARVYMSGSKSADERS